MKQKFQKNRAFYAAIAMIVISAIVLTTASFAWFTLGKTVGVNELDLKVTAKEGLLISGNAKAADNTWTNYLEKTDLDGTGTTDWATYDATKQYLPKTISPTSTDFKFTTGNLPKMLSGGIKESADSWTMQAKDITAADGLSFASGQSATYYAFDVFIKYSGEKDSFTVSVGDSKIKVKDDASDGTTANADAVKAMRLGFVNLGVVASESAAGTTYAKNEAKIYVPPINGTTAYEDAKSVLPVTGAGDSAALDKNTFTVPSGKAGTLTLGSYASGAVATSSSDATLTLEKGINRVRVYIWMEGQDANCTDALQSQLVSAILDFSMI